jgi:hypothetical protein
MKPKRKSVSTSPARRAVRACAFHTFRALRRAGSEAALAPSRMRWLAAEIVVAWHESGRS